MEREVIETRGNYRAVIVREDYAEAPDWDMQAAVISFDGSRWDTYVKCWTDAAQTFEHAAKHFVERYGMSDGILTLERYVRIFHGTRDFTIFGYSYSRDNVAYVAFDSAEMRADWGTPDDATDAARGDARTWQAYIDGDVFGVVIEQRESVHTVRTRADGTSTESDAEDWAEVESVWGYYGEDYARSEAVAQLASYADA